MQKESLSVDDLGNNGHYNTTKIIMIFQKKNIRKRRSSVYSNIKILKIGQSKNEDRLKLLSFLVKLGMPGKIANTRLRCDENDNERNIPRRHVFLETKPRVFSMARRVAKQTL